MKPMKRRLNSHQQRWLRDWWRALQPRQENDAPLPAQLWVIGRGERATLRRCSSADELLFHPATLLLAERLIALDDGRGMLFDHPRSYENVAWTAGVLAVIKNDTNDDKSLAFRLGQAAGKERPLLSELRFRTLQRTTSPASLFTQWRRAVQLADGNVDVALLADDMLGWLAELDKAAARASDGVRFRWACDYYLTGKEQSAVIESESHQEISA